MITFICKEVVKVQSTNKELFIKNREYRAIQSEDEFNFIDYHNDALAIKGLSITLSHDEVKKYFRRKEIIFGR